MDLLLTHGYFLHEDPKELQTYKPYAPLGILYVCSHLRSRGFDVEVFDSTFSSRAQLLAELQSRPPAVLGVYSTLMTRRNVVAIVEAAKECGWTTVVGGPEAGPYAHEYLLNGADYVVIGEGEITLEELLPAIRSGASVDAIHGIAFLGSDGELRQTPPRAQIANLDGQPWPARDAVDIDRYVQVWREHHGVGSVNLITARGCPYKCRWCSHHVFGMTHRRRNPVKVVDELEFLMERYRPDIGWISDDVFTIHPGWLFGYAAEMKKRGLRLPFECISRADRINERVADTLAEIACFRVWIGSESGSQRILNSMQRGVTVEQVQRATDLCKQRGIQTGMFLMWGYEGEAMVDIEATIDHVKRAAPDVFFTTVAYPIKGTPYFNEVASRTINEAEWQTTSDREIRIRGRHSRQYYRFADELLRSEVELHKLGAAANTRAAFDLQQRIRNARAELERTRLEVEA